MLTVRHARPDDAGQILAFIRELAAYERAPDAVRASAEDLRAALEGGDPRVRVLLAEWDARPAGFALFFRQFSTWEGKPVLYLEDLFVRPEFRGRGIGRDLLLRLARIAQEEGCARYQWQVLDWNQPAIEFYRAFGAQVLREWLTCRVEGADLARLAAAGAPVS
jgi:GNAT superfamily N-acetyltransferase